MFTDEIVLYAFALTILAGLSTGLGAAIAFFTKQSNTGFLSLALGFSAGVMVYVSFIEIFPKAVEILSPDFGPQIAPTVTTAAFFGGMLFIGAIDKLIPDYENPHQLHTVEEMDHGLSNLPMDEAHNFSKLKRTGIFAAIAIAIHNFPEGLVTFTAALSDPNLGLAIAVAVAIHNVPEGIAVSVPLYYATGSRKKAFFLSFLSGLAEPAGALIGYLLLRPFLSPLVFGVIFAAVAGIMVFIALTQLLPAAEEYGKHDLCTYGLVGGMVVMALSLLLL